MKRTSTMGMVCVVAAAGVFAMSRSASAEQVESWSCNNGNYCVYGSNSGAGKGILGYGGIGVEGASVSGDGMHAYTTSASHSGIYAQNLASGGGGYGIYAGVGGTGQAVHGQNTNSSGWAGYFDGKVYASQGYTSSDARLKKDIADLPNGLRALAALRPVTFKWKDPNRGDGRHLGFLAQDLQKVVPEVVDKDAKTGMLAVDYPALVPVLAKAIQEQQAIIQRQDARIANLEHPPIVSSMFSPGIGIFMAIAAGGGLLFPALRARRTSRRAQARPDQS